MKFNTQIKLEHPKFLKFFQERFEEIIVQDRVNEAEYFFNFFNAYLKEKPRFLEDYPEAGKQYQKLYLIAQFIALSFLSEQELLDLIEKHFTVIFQIKDYHLEEKLRSRLLNIAVYEERDVLKKKIQKALLNNSEKITEKKIKLGKEESDPIIKNWLRDYISYLGLGSLDKVKQSEYLTNSENIKELSQEEKEKIVKLFNFYETLKFSSLTPQGLEEDVLFEHKGQALILRQGKLEKPEKDLDDFLDRLKGGISEEEWGRIIREHYEGNIEENKKILEEEQKILENTKKDLKKIYDLFYEILVPSLGGVKTDKIKAAALLYLLAKEGKLNNILEDNRLAQIFINLLKVKGRFSELEGFKINPKSPRYLKFFLQYLLEEKIGINTEEAARLFLQAANFHKKATGDDKYTKMVYYDRKEKNFLWSKE